MPALVLHQLRTRHVGPIELTVEAGECVCIRGASGSGKSLLLRAIADLDPHQGEARLDARACAVMPAPQWRHQVALVMAEGQWWAETVSAHFADGCDPAWLERLSLPAAALDWEVARCSTGERQRLALLRTLMRRPAALLLDEPTGNLDEDSTARVEALLDDYRREHGAALLWVSHDPRQAARVAQRRFLLEDGRLVEEEEGGRATTDTGQAPGADRIPDAEGAAW
jgi:ABC-type iron transport system FetAB ATPase subunit